MGHNQNCSHHHDESCSHGSCSCCSHHDQSCGHSHHDDHHEHPEFAKQLIDLADEAWMCLLKEKIRKQVESSAGAQLDELAKIVAESNHNRWRLKLEGDNACKEFKQQVADFFSKKKK
jgi:hypothetical protein